MRSANLGDMAQNYILQRRNAQLKVEMNRLTEELATGKTAEARDVLNGNYAYLTELEKSKQALDAFKVSTTEAGHLASGMQSAVDRISVVAQELSASLLLAQSISLGSGQSISGVDQAYQTLDTVLGSLNTEVAGRSLFSGTATDTSPLRNVDDVLAGVRTAISGALTPDDMIAAAQLWFDDPAGFAATLYQGSPDGLSAIRLSDTESVSLDIKATDPALRNVVMNAALAALADDPAFALSQAEQIELHAKVGGQMLAAQGEAIFLQGRIGFAEERIDQAAARNASESVGIEYAVTELLSVDPYDTATKLEAVQFQLQSLYAVTVRMSQLSLVNYL